MKFSMLQAAKEIGVAQSTMHRYIKNGRVSATRRDDGSYEIDPAELFRAFPPGWRKKGEASADAPAPPSSEPGSGTPGETLALRAELRMLREMLERADLDHNRQRREADGTIADLRLRLDREGEERRALNIQLLAYQGPPPGAPPAGGAAPSPSSAVSPAPRRGLFGRFRKAG